MTKVSVIIPSYNHRHYIDKAIDSVLNQDLEDLELIVIDDGSSDDSLDYLRQVKDPRYTLIEQKNAGAHNAINRGLSLAKGKYIAILNSDDIYHPQRLSRCVAALEEQPLGLVTTWIEVINQQGQALGIKEGWKNMLPWAIPAPSRSFAATQDFDLNLVVSNFVSTTSNMVFSRQLFETIGGMRNLRFAHDWDFMFRAVEQFNCSIIEQPLMQYRIHGSNTISSNRAWMLFEICWVLATGMRRLEGRRFYEGEDPRQWILDAERIHNSVNLQGNDKVFWMINQFIDARKSPECPEPELLLLDNAELRQAYVCHIQTDTSPAPTANSAVEPESLLLLAKRWLRSRLQS